MKLNVKAFALTSGIIWGICLFLITWWVMVFTGSTGTPTVIGRVYLGYNISPIGSIIGMVWAFVDGLIVGGVFSWLYNKLASRSSKTKE